MPDLPLHTQIRLAETAAALLIPWVVRAIVMRAVRWRTKRPEARYQWRKVTQYLATIVMVVAVGRIWLDGLESLATLVGLLGAGIAVALNQPIANIAAWIFIVTRRPFEVGDRVEVGAARGDVIDVGVFQLTLMEVGGWVDADQSTGRIVQVPNAKVFTHDIANYARGFAFIWVELPVLVTFESDWRKAKDVLSAIATASSGDAAERAAAQVAASDERFVVRQQTFTPIVYTTVKDSGVLLTIRLLATPHQRRNVEAATWELILDAFAAEPTIELAYPTQRLYRPELGAAMI